MQAIYEPRGKAREYAPLALNLYRGCDHGCLYCYAPQICHITRENFHDLTFIEPRPGILDSIKRDVLFIPNGCSREILLSFTSDPYQYLDRARQITRRALEILMNNDLTVTILTKSGSWGLIRDLDLLAHLRTVAKPRNTWAVTLTLDDPENSRIWEPNAALPADRIQSLRLAKKAGLKTWVSFEPVLDPQAVYRLLEITAPFTDHYKVGKLNYHPHAKTIDWQAFKEEIESRLQALGKPYYLKKDLLQAAEKRS